MKKLYNLFVLPRNCENDEMLGSNGDIAQITGIQEGMSMISDTATIVGFFVGLVGVLSLIALKLINDVSPRLLEVF